MNQWKWLALSLGLVFAASVGMVGCGDDEPVECTEDNDCDPGEVCGAGNTCATVCESNDDCDTESGIFCSLGCGDTVVSYCFEPCSADGDCAEGFACDTSFCPGGRGICKAVTPTSCTDNDDCDGDEVCDTVAEICVPACTDNTDCEVGFVCNPNTNLCQTGGGGCTDNDQCGEGETCQGNVCTPVETCEGQLDCYNEGTELFCAETSSSTNTCVDTSCGVSFNSCSRCTSGPNGGSRDADGPSIFSARQVQLGSNNCKNDLTQCQADAPILCEFQFFAFSPNEADLPTTSLNNKVFVISGTGNATTGFGVRKGTEGENSTYTVRGCFREGGGASVGTAVFLESVSGKKSNTLCVSGTK